MYKNKNKIIYNIGISIIIAVIFKLLFFRLNDFFDFDLIYIAGVVLILWEGNQQIDKWLNNRSKWLENPKKRLIYQVIAYTLYTSVILFLSMFFMDLIKHGGSKLFHPQMLQIFIPALIIALAVMTGSISIQFFKAWKQSLVDLEKYKTANAAAQLQNLKNQINPHFLFNNLSVLTLLVQKDQDKAVEFINELSKVYRYVLDNKNSELVTLEEELKFLEHYIYLLRIRFDNGISFTLNIDETLETAYLLPMCIQMLVENTIQHNEVSVENPLQVSIYTHNRSLVVENNIKLRSGNTVGTNTGLENIRSRYSYFTDEEVEIWNNGAIFKVVLPLLSKD